MSDPATYAGYAAIIYVALRFIAAPYFVWREEFDERIKLQDQLASPSHRLRASMLENQARLRQEFSRDFSNIVYRENMRAGFSANMDEMLSLRERALEIANFDETFRSAWSLMLSALSHDKIHHELSEGFGDEAPPELARKISQFEHEYATLFHEIIRILHGVQTDFTLERYPYIRSLEGTERRTPH